MGRSKNEEEVLTVIKLLRREVKERRKKEGERKEVEKLVFNVFLLLDKDKKTGRENVKKGSVRTSSEV